MPYVSKWMPLAEAMSRIMELERCDRAGAWEQIRTAIDDGNLEHKLRSNLKSLDTNRWDKTELHPSGAVIFLNLVPMWELADGGGEFLGHEEQAILVWVDVLRETIESWPPGVRSVTNTSAGTGSARKTKRGNAPYDDQALIDQAAQLLRDGKAKSMRGAARLVVEAKIQEGRDIHGASPDAVETRIRKKLAKLGDFGDVTGSH